MPDRELECRRLGTAIFSTQTKLVREVLVFSRSKRLQTKPITVKPKGRDESILHSLDPAKNRKDSQKLPLLGFHY